MWKSAVRFESVHHTVNAISKPNAEGETEAIELVQ
jgi:hypothetical protein